MGESKRRKEWLAMNQKSDQLIASKQQDQMKVKSKIAIGLIKKHQPNLPKSLSEKFVDVLTPFVYDNFFDELNGLERINPSLENQPFNHKRMLLFRAICRHIASLAMSIEDQETAVKDIGQCFVLFWNEEQPADLYDPLIWLFIPKCYHNIYSKIARDSIEQRILGFA